MSRPSHERCPEVHCPIRIFTLGRFGLVVNGASPPSSGKSQKKPLDLLKATIALGSRNVAEQQLSSMLWPDAKTDAAHLLFKTTLHRLRRLIASDRAIICRDGSVSLDNRHCWVDAWAFERLLGQANKAWTVRQDRATAGGLQNTEAARLTEQALGLYQGHFLKIDSNEPFLISLREHLRCLYVSGVVRIGTYYEQSGDVGRAVECYEKGLHVDDLAEEFYQRLIACHLRAGRKAEAVRTWQRCCAALQSCLGAEPSPETRGLCRDILQ
jgi:DNA-binding SARP family transcriptional activator